MKTRPGTMARTEARGPEPIAWKRCRDMEDAKQTALWTWGHWEGSAVYPHGKYIYVNNGHDPNDGKPIGKLPPGAYFVMDLMEYETEKLALLSREQLFNLALNLGIEQRLLHGRKGGVQTSSKLIEIVQRKIRKEI